MKKCIYCNAGLEEDSVIDICFTCMYKVWGEKMANAIVANMKREKANGNLELGRVHESCVDKKEVDIVEEIDKKVPDVAEEFIDPFPGDFTLSVN